MPAVLFPYELTMEVPTEHLFWMYNFLSKLKCRWKFPPTFSLTVKMSLEISTASFLSAKTSLENSPTFFSHSWNVAGNFHGHFFLTQPKCRWKFPQTFFLTQPKCRWKFPPTFSLTAKVPLKISTDIFFFPS